MYYSKANSVRITEWKVNQTKHLVRRVMYQSYKRVRQSIRFFNRRVQYVSRCNGGFKQICGEFFNRCKTFYSRLDLYKYEWKFLSMMIVGWFFFVLLYYLKVLNCSIRNKHSKLFRNFEISRVRELDWKMIGKGNLFYYSSRSRKLFSREFFKQMQQYFIPRWFWILMFDRELFARNRYKYKHACCSNMKVLYV